MAGISGARLKVILWQALGYFFLVLGVLGTFLPILQGFLFLAIGLIILARHAPWAERLLNYLRQKSPRLDRTIAKAEARIHEWRHRAEAKSREWRYRAGAKCHEWQYRAEVHWHRWRIRTSCRARLWRARMAELVRRY
jgi:uncharacterized protein